MYKPLFNKVLVEIDDKDAQWGKSSDANLGGEVYREGKVLEVGHLIEVADYPQPQTPPYTEELPKTINELVGKQVMWHEGHEAGTVFEDGGKKYALIYWFDLIGAKDDK